MAGVIEQVVRLRDEASKVLDTVAGNAEEAGAEIEDMTGEAKDAGKELDTMGKGADRASESSAQLAAGAAAAGAALLAMIQNVADSTNEITDWSTRTNVAAETLAGLRLAAQGSGLEFQALAEPLLALTRNTAQAAQGNADLEAKFKALGIATTDTDGSLRSTDGVLRDLMRRLADMKDPAERAAAATALLGEQGTRFLQALGNPAALDHFVEQARLFGVDVGPKAAAAAGQWQRAVATLQTVVQGVGQDLLTAFGAGSAGGVVEDFTLGIVYMGTIAETVVKEVTDSFRSLFDGIGKLASGDFAGAFDDITESALMNTLGAMPEALDKAAARMEALRQSMRGVADAAGSGGGTGGGFVGAMQAAADAAEKLGKAADMGTLGRSIDFLGRVQTGQNAMSGADFGMTSDQLSGMFSTAFQNAMANGETKSRLAILFATAMGEIGKTGPAVLGAINNPLGALSATGPQGAAIATSLQALEQIGREGPEKIVQRLEAQTMAIGQGIAQMPELFFLLIDRLPNAIGKAVGEAIRGLFDVKEKIGGGNTLETLLNVGTGGLYGMNKGILQGLGIVGDGRSSNSSNARTMGAMGRRAGQAAMGGGGNSITINGFVDTEVLDAFDRHAGADFSPWGVGRGRRPSLGG